MMDRQFYNEDVSNNVSLNKERHTDRQKKVYSLGAPVGTSYLFFVCLFVFCLVFLLLLLFFIWPQKLNRQQGYLKLGARYFHIMTRKTTKEVIAFVNVRETRSLHTQTTLYEGRKLLRRTERKC